MRSSTKFLIVILTISLSSFVWFRLRQIKWNQKKPFFFVQQKEKSADESAKAQATQSSILSTKITNNRETQFKSKLYQLINAYRQEKKLSPLRINQTLELSSQLKLNDMIKYHYWRHIDKQNRAPWQFFDQANYHYQLAGENLAFDQPSAWHTFHDWMQSKRHNQQLLEPKYEDMGLTVDCHSLKSYSHNSGCLVVLHLGKQ